MLNQPHSIVHIGVFAAQGCSLPNYALIIAPFLQGNQILAGQLAIMDCLLSYLKQQEADPLIHQLSDHLCIDRVRGGNEQQRLPSQSLGGENLNPRLTMAIDLMENNIEQPLTTEQIADLVCISLRQLECLFKCHLNTMPARHYLQIRLKLAQHLLQTSSKSIVQIVVSQAARIFLLLISHVTPPPRQERAKFLNVK